MIIRKLPAILAIFVAALLLLGSAPERPPSEDKPTDAEKRAQAELAKAFRGRIVFDSNRGNGFGIHVTDVRGEKIVPLVDTERHEMYPDVSPDGKWVVYSSSKKLDKKARAEIFIVPSTGGEPRRLAVQATFPTFSSDGKSVYFERSREKIMKLDLATNVEEELFPKGNPEWTNRRVDIVKPQASPNGRMIAFISNRPRKWTAWFVNLDTNEVSRVGPGCEPTWFPSGDRIAWVGGEEVLERSAISGFDLSSKNITKVQDAGAPRGHEYFPTITDNSRFLLYSAAREGEHTPTSANYQIFVKDLTSGAVTRITFDPHTNRWPRLLPELN